MDFMDLQEGVHVLPGAVNMGLVETSEGLVAIDTGLDKQAGKRLIRAAEALGKPLVTIVNTHAHADHFGGNATILARFPDAQVMAPVDEAAVIRQPQFEPQYLWQGASPFGSLQNKFLLGAASKVDTEFSGGETWSIGSTKFAAIFLPGHAHGQCGILVDGVLFAADSYFGAAVTDKHGIPFMVNYEQTLASAKAAASVDAAWWVPGHGDPAQDATADVNHLCNRHEEVYREVVKSVAATTRAGVDGGHGVTLDTLTGLLCNKFGLSPNNPGAWLLVHTTMAAYASAAIQAGTIEPVIEDNILRLTSTESF